MRKRKRQGTIIRQYKYSASTDLRPLPPEFWDIAKRMQQAWNALIPAYATSEPLALNQRYNAIWEVFRADKDEAGYQAAKKSADSEKQEVWRQWDQQAKTTIASFGLDYSQGPNVIERFNGCIKAGRTCFPETELSHVQIPLIFPGSAAIPTYALYNNRRRWRLIIEGVTDGMFRNNSRANRRERRMVYVELGLSRSLTIPLRVDWHRPLPSPGTVKRVLVCGKKLPLRGWRWHLLFQIEHPISQTVPRTEKSVALRICWTRFEDSIIAAQWKDSSGREGILTLPLTPTNHQDRRTRERRPEWQDWLFSYKDLEFYKATEFALPRGSVERMKMRERRRRVEERWQARRRDRYRNFAAWVVGEYAKVDLPDLNIKSIAEDDSKQGALMGADRWRQVAAPGDLLAILKETAQKHGRRVEAWSQTSIGFQSLMVDPVDVRRMIEAGAFEVFDVRSNSKAVARGVHAG